MMAQFGSEFGIAEEPIYKNGQWHLAGRCVTNIQVGTRFVKFIRHREEVDINGNRTCYAEEALSIDLIILEIHKYGRMFQEWDAGHTALLVLSGDGSNLQSYGSLVSELPNNYAPGQAVGHIRY